MQGVFYIMKKAGVFMPALTARTLELDFF